MNVVQTDDFSDWLQSLRDIVARRAIVRRLLKLQADDHFGDVKALGDGLNEMRFDVGPGYRVYFTVQDDGTIVLTGGTKRTQGRDITKAKKMIDEL